MEIEPRSIIGKLIKQITATDAGARHEEEEVVKNVGATAFEGVYCAPLGRGIDLRIGELTAVNEICVVQ